MTPCELIYQKSSKPIYGDIAGVCRITGKEGAGLVFSKWIKPTFTDLGSLKAGTIISNEALFCFDEQSTELQAKTGKELPQRFRTYSHIIDVNDNWHCVTKAHKEQIYNYILEGAKLVSLTDSGQKHLLFKHKIGFWQLDDLNITPDIETFKLIHETLTKQLNFGLNQTAAITGDYPVYTLAKLTKEQRIAWNENEQFLKKYRGKGIFDFTAWLLFNPK